MNSCRSISVALILYLASSAPASAECQWLGEFNQAIEAKNVENAKVLEARIRTDAVCGPLGVDVTLRRTSLEVVLAERLAGLPGREVEREELLRDADQPDVYWGAAVALAALRFGQRRFAEASNGFERAIEIIKNPTKTPVAPSQADILEILELASRSRQLAANEEGSGKAVYVRANRDFRDNKLGGSFSEDIRGVKPKRVPLPVNFETATAKPTAIGRQALAELLEAMKEQQPPTVLVVGHTDERGAADYNMRLSEARALAVKKFLLDSGITAKIDILPRGKSEPVKISDATGLTQEDIWALNRRTEWRRP